nr:uncharacterized mitochondrial protein AtMg00810-like [Tanacetum cinerariifolium]
MSIMGELTYFLGLQIKQDDKGISICQEQYTRNLLKKYEIFESRSHFCGYQGGLLDPELERPFGQSKGITSYCCEKNPQVLESPHEDDSEDHPLKEYKIKFRVLNGKRTLTLDFKAFAEATGTYAKYQVDPTHSTRFEVSVPDQHQGKTSSKVEPDTEIFLLTTIADIQALPKEGDLIKESGDDIFKTEEEMNKDIQEPNIKET